MIEKIIEPIPVLCVMTEGVSGSAQSFNELEQKIGSLQGRKFYGVLVGNPETGVYRACVQIKSGEKAEKLGLKEWIIPGGKYAQEKIINWNKNLSKIPQIAKEISLQYKIDPSRPTLEYYYSMKELRFMMPII